MAHQILLFGILGLGAGAVYGLSALGLVVVYRTSGVLNFAAGPTGMVGAFIFYGTRSGTGSTELAFLAAISFAVVIGMAMQAIIRSLRKAPPISLLIANLAVFTALLAWATDTYGSSPAAAPSLMPTTLIQVLPGIRVQADQIILLGVGVALTAALSWMHRKTIFGLKTEAVAENLRFASALGISSDSVAAANWIIASLVSVLGTVLVVDVTGLSVANLSLLVVPALAAALLGALRSPALAFCGGLIVGIAESEVGWLQSYLSQQAGHFVNLQGWPDTIPFAVIIVVLAVRGTAFPVRGESAGRRPEMTLGSIRIRHLVGLAALVTAIAVFGSDNLLAGATLSAGFAIVLLSLVVVTGFAGQLSLAQLSFAGFGAWVAAYLVANHGFSFPVAALAGVAASIPVGAIVGVPSLRARGANLAVVTLGLAVVIEAQIFQRASLTGGLSGLNVGSPNLFGLDLDTFTHPARYFLLAALCFAGMGMMVLNLRRSRAGRRLVAVCSNERAAASLGISVRGAKLYAFSISAGIAAVGGVLIVFMQPTAVFEPTFSAVQSVFAVVNAVIGGIGFVLGALIGGGMTLGGIGPTVVGTFVPAINSNDTLQLILALGLLVVLVQRPSGLALSKRMRRRRPTTALPDLTMSPQRVEPARLTLSDVSVSYGKTPAVDRVSLSVSPGEILGVIGPNGAGKTSLIDAITGFARSTGDISLADVRVETWSPSKRSAAGLGRSFQQVELFETMTVAENLRTADDPGDKRAYLFGLFRRGSRELSIAAAHSVVALGLADDLDRRPSELPFGRRRLAALARAITRRPSVLLLDEPASGLSGEEADELAVFLRTLAADWGIAIVLVEHNVELVMRVCDRITVLNQGRELATGTPEEIRSHPEVLEAYFGRSDADQPKLRRTVREGEVGNGAPSNAPDRAVVSVNELAGGYGDIPVFEGVSLTVAAGEVVALLGPNGAGKTTLLLTLAGELSRHRGDATVAGIRLPASLRRLSGAGVAFVPEGHGTIARLTCDENLSLGWCDRAMALELFPELLPLLHRRAELLSGGEQQILALARALSRKPTLLIVDELSLGLAPQVVERLLSAIRTAADEHGTAVLIVEQDAARVLSIADRGVILRNGCIDFVGTAAGTLQQLGTLDAAQPREANEKESSLVT